MTMIERMARTLAKHSAMGEDGWRFFVGKGIAQDAIKVMREPTEAMSTAAYADMDAHGYDKGDPISTYRAMIDAALQETE